jgi:hypothetical protein
MATATATGCPAIFTPAEELCNPAPYVRTIRVEIAKKFFEFVQLYDPGVISCPIWIGGGLIWMGDEHRSSIRFFELPNILISIRVKAEEIEYIHIL